MAQTYKTTEGARGGLADCLTLLSEVSPKLGRADKNKVQKIRQRIRAVERHLVERDKNLARIVMERGPPPSEGVEAIRIAIRALEHAAESQQLLYDLLDSADDPEPSRGLRDRLPSWR